MISYDITEFGAPLARRERPTPAPQGTEVVLRVRAAGVCHSDVHIHEGFFDLGGGQKISMASRGMKLPHTLGHETVGEIAALGPDARGVERGARYLVYPWIGCGACGVCRDELHEQHCMAPRFIGVQCAGGYADHIVVPHPRYLLDIGALPAAVAAPYACSGLTSYSALKKLGAMIEREAVVVIGAGGLGLQAIGIHKALKGKAAIAVDIDPAKRAAALATGAAAAIDGAAPDAIARIKAAAGGQVWSVIDLVGSPQTAQLGIDCLAKGGRYIIVGLFGGAITLPLPILPQRALTIQGSYTGSLGELKELLELVRRADIAPIPTAEVPLAEANATLERLRAGQIVGRAVLTA
jgi:D-arabinose 1-dehydrogenase-like Zn-dependent alcohol dehydrogenase